MDLIDWPAMAFSEEASLCYIVSDGSVLLIHKKTGLGKGMINAPGGRLEAGETPLDAAIRETIEEVCVTPSELQKVAMLHFIFTNGYSLKGHVYRALSYEGIPVKTREADPFWCAVNNIPYANMWADDILWLPDALEGRYSEGFFVFEDEKMLSQRVVFGTQP